jgi:hypothetical protein
MSNSSEFCGDHVNLFRGFLARMSHPNKLLVERLSEKGKRSLPCSLTEHQNGTFRPIFASQHVQIHAQSVVRTPFRTVSEGKFSEVHTHNPAYSPDRVPLIGPGEWKFSRKFSVASRYCLLLFAVPFVSM